MPEPRPPFRADMVGSLLRTPRLREARAGHAEGRITDAELKRIEDEEIEAIVARQEAIGLRLATDGEFRRSWWHFDFLWGLDGVERTVGEKTIKFHGVDSRPESVAVTGRLDFPADHPMLDHFRFLKSVTKVEPKMTIPSPSVLHFRGGRQSISREVYPDLDAFFDDLGATYAKTVRAFYDAGCRYLQLDDTVWAYLCDPNQIAEAKARGEDVEKLPATYARTINRAVEGRPDDMTVTMHVCRGNFRSSWIASGGYEPVAETVLGGLRLDGYFLEYDTERAGGFEPLRFTPKGEKRVVLGLVSSKVGELEDKDAVKRRIEEATRYVTLDQLCLSPQCGFASTEEGNLLAHDQQWAKLAEIVEIADEVWGRA